MIPPKFSIKHYLLLYVAILYVFMYKFAILFFFSFSSLINVFIAVSTAVVSPKKANVVICCGQLPLISTGKTLLVLNARSA